MGRYIYKDIVFTGSAGLSGALSLAAQDPEMVKKRFPAHMIGSYGLLENKSLDDRFLKEAICRHCAGDGYTVVCAENTGVTEALWTLGEELCSGLRVYAERIPVSQVTVEICELFGTDPFRCESKGCFLIAAKNGNELCEKLKEEGEAAVVIGHDSESKGRVMVFGEITRYLDKPRHV